MTRTQGGLMCAALAALWLCDANGGWVLAQTGGYTGGSINLGARGGIAPEVPLPAAQDRPDSPVEFGLRAGLASDYIYRGTTLSADQSSAQARSTSNSD